MIPAPARVLLLVLLSVPASQPLAAGPPISLDQARSLALERNPDLQSARLGVEAAAGARRQARAWSNPEFEISAEDLGGDRPGLKASEWTWAVAQPLELFGTREARSRAAFHAGEEASGRAGAVRLDLLAEIDARFADALAARERLRTFAAHESLAAEAVRAVSALVEAGEVSPIEIDRVEADRAAAVVQLRAADLDYANALRSLAALWGSPEPDFTAVAGSLAVESDPPDRALVFSAGMESPALREAVAGIGRAEAELDISRRSRYPALVIRGGLKRFRETDEQSYLGGVAFTLPLLDRGGGSIEADRARVKQARVARSALESRIRRHRAAAHEGLTTALESARILRDERLVRAGAVYDGIHEGFLRGKFGLLDLIDARRTLLHARLEYIDALRSVWHARAELQRWTGGPANTEEGES